MKRNGIGTLYRIYQMIATVFILLAGVCLMAGCIYIFAGGGEHPYSRERVGEVLAKIAIPLLACLIVILAGFLFGGSASSPAGAVAKKPGDGLLSKRIREADVSQADPELLARVEAERSVRGKRTRICTSLMGICFSAAVLLAVILYVLLPEEKINLFVILSFAGMLPLLAVPFGYQIYRSIADSKSLHREFELLRALPRRKVCGEAEARKIVCIQVALLLVAAVSLTAGALLGGTADVLTKAANICTECIGLG